jgi:tetratricopeptide (TPR) repeat protein
MWSGIAVRRARRATEQGELLLSRGNLRGAEVRFATAIAQAHGKTVQPRTRAAEVVAGAHVGLGRTRLALADPRRALPEFRAAQLLQPEAWQPFYWDGCARGWVGDYPGAEQSFSAALRCRPRLGRAYLQRGYARLRQGHGDAALEDLLAAREHGELEEPGRLVLAWLRLQRREWAEAEALLRPIEVIRSSPLVTSMRAFALEQQGDLHAAVDLYGQAIRRGRADDSVLFHHGLAAYGLRRFDDSIRSWTELQARNPHRTRVSLLVARANYAWALELARQRRYGAAVERLETAEELKPPGALDAALTELRLHAAAQALRHDGEAGREEALQHLEADLARGGDDPRVLHYLGLLEGLDGAPAQAVELLEEVVASRPEDERARYALALCAVQAGDPDRGAQELGALRAGDRGPLGTQAAQALAALQIRRGHWSLAADTLEVLPEGDPWRAAVLPECLYRSGRLTDLLRLPHGSGELEPWQALARMRLAPSDGASAALLRTAGTGQGTARRARREVGLLLRKAALAEARAARWEEAASLLAESHGRAVAPTSSALLDAVALMLGGQREPAVSTLAEASRRDPSDHRLTHGLALMLLHGLSSNAGSREPGRDAASWRQCIAAWIALLHDRVFWERWRDAAQERYGVAVPASFTNSLKRSLEDLLQGVLAAGDGAGASPRGESSRELLLLLQREMEAARSLEELGGFPPPGAPDRYLVCGPLRIRELRLEREFGAFVAASLADRGGQLDTMRILLELVGVDPGAHENAEPERAHRDRLFRSFSQLGIAHVHMIAGRPRDALEALSDLRCPSCQTSDLERRALRRAAAWPAVCAADCQLFDAYNPAYAALEDKHRQLADDAMALSVDAWLSLGRAAVTAGAIDTESAASHWREAINLAERLGQRQRTERRVVEMALGRAQVLQRRGDLDEAIALLDVAYLACAASIRSRVAGRLAELLTNRGIAVANEDPYDADRMQGVVEDLRRAVTLNPHLPRALVNLARALRLLSKGRLDQGRSVEATELLREAVGRVEEGLSRIPGQQELEEELHVATGQLHLLIAMLGRFPGRGGR